MAGQSVRDFLTNTKLVEITGGGSHDIVCLREDTTVELALRTLAANRILSAPVVSAKKDVGIVGFCDLYGILSSFLLELDLKAINGMKMLQRLRVLEQKGQDFAVKTIKSLDAHGTDGDFLHKGAAESATLRDIIHSEFLFPKETKLGTSPRAPAEGGRVSPRQHRVALFDKSGKVTNIVSQSDIVRYLTKHAEQLGPLAERTVESLGWGNKPLISVTPDKPAIEAMQLMVERGISAVAVVAATGKLIGNFSVSELRTIMSEHFGSLALPVGEFLALEHGTEYEGYTIHSEKGQVQETPGGQFVAQRSTRARPHTPGQEVGQVLVCVPPSATLGLVLSLVTKHRLHRIYVVDDAGTGKGIVTLTDILLLVMGEGQGL